MALSTSRVARAWATLRAKVNSSSRLGRLLRIVLFALLGLEVLYVAGVNAILWTKSVDHAVTGATKGLSLQIDGGWSVWPGRVHAKRVELHFEDYNIQLSVVIENTVVDVALWQLPTKTFHLTRVRGDGVRFLLRHKVKSAEGLERRLAQYPKIAGYSDPPLFEGPRKPPLTDEQYNLWTVQLHDVDVGVREAWFLEYRVLGRGRARGGFRVKPERSARTEPCSLVLNGRLQIGDGEQIVASELSGRIQAQLDQHDPRIVEGMKVFEKISFSIELNGKLPGLAFAELYTEPHGPQLRRGQGTLRAQADLRHGQWQESTRIRYETEGITLMQGHAVLAGALALSSKVVHGGKDSRAELSLDTARLALAYIGSPKGLQGPTAHDVHASIDHTADLTRPIRITSVHGKLNATVPELRWLNYPLESKDRFTGGSARATANLQWSDDKAHGKTTLEIKNAAFALDARPVQVSGSVNGQLVYDAQTQRGHFSQLEVELPAVMVSIRNKFKAVPGGLHARAARLHWQGSIPRRWDGRFELHADSIDPLIPFVISSNLLRAIAKALIHLGKTDVVVDAKRTPSALELELEGKSGDVRALGILRDEKSKEHMCGRFFINDGSLGVGVVLYDGKSSISPLVSSNWWRERPPTTSCGPEQIPAQTRELARSENAGRDRASQ